RLAGNLLRFDVEIAMTHVIAIGFMTWIVAGFLRHGLVASRTIFPRPQTPIPSIGALEVAIVLGVLDLLFLGFVAVQFRYLFGGEAFMRETVGLSLATFARRGFFDLVAVSVLSLP